MEIDQARQLRNLLDTQRIASLGTLHHGHPYVSMVPFALWPSGTGVVIHVSQLSPHTQDMRKSPAVSLLVIAVVEADASPAAIPRVTIQGDAIQVTEDAAEYEQAKDAYLTRFPDAAMRFALADFSLFLIRPRTVRFIAGFGQAMNVTPEAFAHAAGGGVPGA